jgi:hypothetical protein
VWCSQPVGQCELLFAFTVKMAPCTMHALHFSCAVHGVCASIPTLDYSKQISCWTNAHISRVLEAVTSLSWECIVVLHTSLQEAGQPQASVSLPLAQCFPEDVLQLVRRHMLEALLELLICKRMPSTCTKSGDWKLNTRLLAAQRGTL